ncbi:MAG TPA: hypothetical protein V6D19_06800 [Stenomitos sp.]
MLTRFGKGFCNICLRSSAILASLMCGVQPVGSVLASPVTVVISNSGSTNTPGYQIDITPSGRADYTHAGQQSQAQLPSDLATKLFQDLEVARPLSQLPDIPCATSVSFGSTLLIRVGEERSPDLNCPGNQQEATLKQDVEAIVKALNIETLPASVDQGHLIQK